MFRRLEKCLEALVGPFSAAYLAICALIGLASSLLAFLRFHEALKATSGSLRLSPLSFFFANKDMSDPRS